MILQQRIDILVRLGNYINENNEEWQIIKERANRANNWFIPEFIDMAAKNLSEEFLQKDKLDNWAKQYKIPAEQHDPKTIGLVMAGNIPMVGFHDMLCIFISGHYQRIKPSSNDAILITHLVHKLAEWNNDINKYISFAENLKGCDGYIATGSNNSSRYFDYYFGKYPNIIRRNRTSVTVLDGTETPEELDKLADDIQTYFGLGCRNVTKLFVPEDYDFEDLLQALNKYDYYGDLHKYRNNYDYQLALLMMGNKFYMTNGTIILSKDPSLFTAVSRVNYEFYNDREQIASLTTNHEIQCVVGHDYLAFGNAQKPSLYDFADGVNTMHFLLSLN